VPSGEVFFNLSRGTSSGGFIACSSHEEADLICAVEPFVPLSQYGRFFSPFPKFCFLDFAIEPPSSISGSSLIREMIFLTASFTISLTSSLGFVLKPSSSFSRQCKPCVSLSPVGRLQNGRHPPSFSPKVDDSASPPPNRLSSKSSSEEPRCIFPPLIPCRSNDFLQVFYPPTSESLRLRQHRTPKIS